MKALQPVAWTKGSVLTPQHLQAQETYFETTLRFHLEGMRSYCWGFTELTFDDRQLERGIFSIRRASGLLPDGMPFDIPDSDNAPAARALKTCFLEADTSASLMLAVPVHQSSRPNIGAAGGKRYSAETRELPDDVTGGPEKMVEFLRKNIVLLTATEAQDGYMSLPLARVTRTKPTSYALDPTFIPPTLQIRASSQLMAMSTQLAELVLARSNDLSDMRRQRNSSLAQFSSADVARFWLLYTVNSMYASLRHLSFGTTHPEELFNEMLSLTGALTAFSVDTHPTDLPDYNHTAPGECFALLNRQLRRLLDTVIRSNVVSVRLQRLQPFVYSSALETDRHLPLGVSAFLGVKSSAKPQHLIAAGPDVIKIGPIHQIEELFQRAVHGVPLSSSGISDAIPIKTDFEYFRLNTSDDKWDGIRNAGNIAVYVPGEFPDAVLELILVLPEIE